MDNIDKIDKILQLLASIQEVQLISTLSAIFAMVTAVTAIVAIIISLKQIKKSEDAIEAEVFLSFSDRYNSEEMAQALRLLRDAYAAAKDKNNFALNWNLSYSKNAVKAKNLNNARRLVSRYFMDVGRLYKGNVISERLAILLLTTESSEIFVNICEPMNDARHPNRPQTISNVVRMLFEKIDTSGVRLS